MKYFEIRLVAVIIAIALGVALVSSVNAASLGEELFVAKIEESGVQFVYSTEGRVTLIKTEATAELVDNLVADKPLGVDVIVVAYTNTGNRSPGYELTYEE